MNMETGGRKYTRGGTGNRYSFPIHRDKYTIGIRYENGDCKASGNRLNIFEEMLLNRNMPAKLKGKVCNAVIRPAIIILVGQKCGLQRRYKNNGLS